MKRQGGNIVNQPAVKKPDVVSTDLRSKIGAKLQTLLNGFTPDAELFPRSRRQLYEDLFGKRQHSQIIIDPTIVIKEEPDEEEGSNDATSFNSNFLLSAKSRITELLNKKQDPVNKYPFKDNEKENSEYAQSSSIRLSSTQTKAKSLLKNSFSRKRKCSSTRDNFSEPINNQVRLKNLVVVVEDIMNSNDSTKLNHPQSSNLIESEHCSSNIESNSNNISTVREQSTDLAAKDPITSEISDSFVSTVEVQCLIEEGSPIIGDLSTNPPLSNDKYNSIDPQLNNSKSPEIPKTSESILLSDSPLVPDVIPLGDILLPESTNLFPCNNADNFELVDDPGIHQDVVDIASDSAFSDSNHAIHEPEVVLLCVKRPTHEVITLEDDNDDSDEIIEEVHECDQCGKAFRAKSLLNFHIRMHGNDLSPSSESQS